MFICNITGQNFNLEQNEKSREGGSRFGFNSRFRAICYCLTKNLFGEVKILEDIEINKNIKGIGMSDCSWANICEEKFNYVNTFYHKDPFLDIHSKEHIENYKDLDFIISSDVFEHINPYPSLQNAFDNMYSMLKSGGFIIFSVPFTYNEHIEHYPDLYDYKIINDKNTDNYYLLNTTIDGKNQYYQNLVFHGGPGSTLEMRVYSYKSLNEYLKKAGFINIKFHSNCEDMGKYGIFWESKCSLIITAEK